MTGKEILEKHIKESRTGVSQKMRLLSNKHIELAAMREVAEMAFEAGFHHFQSGFYHGWRVGMSPNTIQTTPSKEEFINSLFPEET